ncbi:hypothetical protein [Commensalibacter papalotli (ex Servin-Garciduenas et al. 2014)]|uniref:Uncharacterized protein n=1 Tax=Commensalibacter papalotli (ex Servin-Garciduenas et al. 2014) TaxID=1208583 RepID=W7E088_9PROT|nr:hypothetical protein [Commensalibacter papalotli (ex Servin-Garciduenas et al. 2014)]EUK18359.1 hypothetical protein COMX_01385 [Commensalibacter papalotli (ex Servin-Garciduenas et al. 2014)]
MKHILKYGSFIFLLSINLSVSAKVVHSIDQIPSQIHSEEGKAVFAQEMNGDKFPDGFGSHFLSMQSALKPQDIIKIIYPQGKDERWSLIGVKPWPGQKDRYIVVACSTKITQKELDKDQKNSCSYDINPKSKIVIAVVDYDGSGMLKLIAQPYIETVVGDENGYVDDDNGDALEKSAFNLKNGNGEVVVGNLQRLDFAHYQLNSQILAFGIRFGAEVGYAGGNDSTQAMTLFAILQGTLRPVLKADMYHFENIAGDWHKDGTRDHDISEEEYVLSILPHQTTGFYDIKHTQKGSRNNNGKIYHWNDQKLQYQ